MKILVSADWHLKLGAKNIPNDWSCNRYRMLFKQLHTLEDKVDLHVVAGDIFDRLPNMEELSLYFEFIKGCTIETILLPGNHCSLKKDTTFLTHLKEVTNSINPLVRIIDDYFSNELYDVIPYNKLKEFNPKNFSNKILFTHCRGAIEPFVKPEIDLDLFNRWDIVLLGDLHSYENSQRNLLYPGSPCTTSFHRNVVDTGVIILDSETLTHSWVKLQLPQLIRKTIQAGDDMPATDYHHTIYEIEGDMAELGALADSSLIDKKVVKRETDTALILDPKMTIQEEVREYLSYILQLSDNTVEDVLQVLNNNMNKIVVE
jgi:DNA repair exonuclease SbcCD nuclease subunit